MQKDSSVEIIYAGDSVSLIDGSTEIFKYATKENLDRALELLKRINSLKTRSGEPIYETCMVDRYSVWTFSQSYLFWSHLRYFAKYESLVKEILGKGHRLKVKGKLPDELIRVLRLSGCAIINDPDYKTGLKSFLGLAAISILAYLSGFIAILKAKLLGIEVLVYTPDRYDERARGDFRVKSIYDFLHDNKIKYIEIFHTVPGRMFFRNFVKRKRPALYLEYLKFSNTKSIGNEWDRIDTNSFSSHQRTYINSLLSIATRRVEDNIKHIFNLKKLFSLLSIKRIIALDDMRYMPAVLVASKPYKIKSYGFQHGQFTKYHIDWMNYGIPASASVVFDTLYVWNDYWKKILLRYSQIFNARNTAISGPIREPKGINFVRKRLPNNTTELSLLVSFERLAPRKEVKKFLDRLLEMGATIYLGVRPDIPVEEQVGLYGMEPHPRVHFWKDIDKELLERVDGVMGTYSTFLNEMMYYDLPVFLMDTSFTMGSYLLEDEVVFLLKNNFEFSDVRGYLENHRNVKDIVWPQTEQSIITVLRRLLL